jgi:hypothetical protein
MQNPAAVADLLSVDWYSEQWPLIPRAELEASAVDFPYQDGDGSWATRKVLMHKRRVTEEHLSGTAPAKVCEDCHEAFWKARPTVSKWSLSQIIIGWDVTCLFSETPRWVISFYWRWAEWSRLKYTSRAKELTSLRDSINRAGERNFCNKE